MIHVKINKIWREVWGWGMYYSHTHFFLALITVKDAPVFMAIPPGIPPT